MHIFFIQCLKVKGLFSKRFGSGIVSQELIERKASSEFQIHPLFATQVLLIGLREVLTLL